MRHEQGFAHGQHQMLWSGAYQRACRHQRESIRARQRLLLLLAADHRSRFDGPDAVASSLAAALGFDSSELVIARAVHRNRAITCIVVPRRVWHHQLSKVLDLRAECRALGLAPLLIPERQLGKQPRLGNAERIAAASLAVLSERERHILESQLRQRRSLPLSTCADLLAENPDPVAAVLNLVRAGRAWLSLNRRIDAQTLIHLGEQE